MNGHANEPTGIGVRSRQLVIVGDSGFAEVAWAYFEGDSDYRVRGFAVEREYLKRNELFGLPVVALDEVDQRFPPVTHDVYVAITYTQLNRLRTRLCQSMRQRGYRLASYVSTAATVSPHATLGEHCFIFEHNVIQPFAKVGSNVVLWSGNHIGHHSTIADNVFVSSHVVVSGYCTVGECCFLGVNASIANNVNVAADCWIGPGAVVSDDTEPGQIYRAPKPQLARADVYRFFRVSREPRTEVDEAPD